MKIFIFLTLLALFSCQAKEQPPFLDDEKAAQILVDLALAESATNGLTGASKDSLFEIYQKQVFQMNGVSKDDYLENTKRLSQDIERTGRVVKRADEILKNLQKVSH